MSETKPPISFNFLGCRSWRKSALHSLSLSSKPDASNVTDFGFTTSSPVSTNSIEGASKVSLNVTALSVVYSTVLIRRGLELSVLRWPQTPSSVTLEKGEGQDEHMKGLPEGHF